MHIFVNTLKTKLRYRLSADSRATRVVFLILAVKSTLLPKNAKIKCLMSKNLIRIVRKKSHSYRSPCRVKTGTPLPWLWFAKTFNVILGMQEIFFSSRKICFAEIWKLNWQLNENKFTKTFRPTNFCIHSLNFSLEFFIMIFFNKSAKFVLVNSYHSKYVKY